MGNIKIRPILVGETLFYPISIFDAIVNPATRKTLTQTFAQLATVATTGSYTDLAGKPTIPTVNDSVITVNQGGNKVGSFSLNQNTGATINLQEGKVYSNATQTEDGLMSSADKKKLDGIGTGNYLTQEDADKRYMAKEHVVVTLTTTAGSVEGLKIHVQDSSGNEIYFHADLTWKGTAIEFDISAGVAYKIVGDTLFASGYAVCRPESATRVSSAGSTNNVTLAYNPQKLGVGVYIETLDGKAVTADKYSGGMYDENSNVNSVLVVTSSWVGRIFPSANMFYTKIKFTPISPDRKISKTMDDNPYRASLDMDGAGNTDAILNVYGRTLTKNFAAGYAYNMIFPSGKHGYVPAKGEANTIILNKHEINKSLLKLFGISPIGKEDFLTSTQYSETRVWSSTSYDFCDTEFYILVLST